jgi:hypothetical protein
MKMKLEYHLKSILGHLLTNSADGQLEFLQAAPKNEKPYVCKHIVQSDLKLACATLHNTPHSWGPASVQQEQQIDV